MRFIAFLLLFYSFIFGYDEKTELQIQGVTYNNYTNELLATGDVKLRFESDVVTTNIDLSFFYSSTYQERRYALIKELYLSKEFDTYSIHIGKEIQFWGELEGYNIADVYNQKNYLQDPFDKSSKYGTWGGNIIRYFDENSLGFGLKVYEADIELPQDETPFAPLAFKYDEKLQLSDSRYSPTLYIIGSVVSEDFLESEAKLIFLHGYDTKRYFIPKTATTLSQYAYRVNKALFLAHSIYNDTIFKTELGYTDIINDTKMSDYTQLSFGVEKSIYDLFGSDITLYGEYYRYIYHNENTIKNVDISEVYDNDLFLAFMLNCNDIRNSTFKAGLLYDLTKTEHIAKVTFKSRLIDSFMLSLEYLLITAKTKNSILYQFNDTNRVNLSLLYTF